MLKILNYRREKGWKCLRFENTNWSFVQKWKNYVFQENGSFEEGMLRRMLWMLSLRGMWRKMEINDFLMSTQNKKRVFVEGAIPELFLSTLIDFIYFLELQWFHDVLDDTDVRVSTPKLESKILESDLNSDVNKKAQIVFSTSYSSLTSEANDNWIPINALSIK